MFLFLMLSLLFGFIWVLRGGAFGALCRKFLKFEPGTTLTRIATMAILAGVLSLCYGNIWLMTLTISMWIQLALTGWGSYMVMTQPRQADDNEKMKPILKLFGLKDHTSLYNFVGMTLTGLWMTILPGLNLLVLQYFGLLSANVLWVLLFVMIAPIYFILSLINNKMPVLSKIFFDGWTQYSEFFTGIAIGYGLYFALV